MLSRSDMIRCLSRDTVSVIPGLCQGVYLFGWENYMPLARYAMLAWGTQVYVAPTWDRDERWLSTLPGRSVHDGGIIRSAVEHQCDFPILMPGLCEERIHPTDFSLPNSQFGEQRGHLRELFRRRIIRIWRTEPYVSAGLLNRVRSISRRGELSRSS